MIDTAIVQPALFTVEYALARLLMTLGLGPVATIGHSIGEYVSACLAGVFSLEDALALVAERGRLMQLMPAGAMAAIGLAESALRPRLVPGVAIAAVNGPEICLVSGPTSAVQSLERTLVADQVMVRRLHASHAFHSPMMLPIVEPFRRAVAAVSLRPPTLPFLSCLTGTWIKPDEATSPDYWARHVLEAVRFADAVAVLLGDESFIPIEVGPGNSLAQLAAQQPLARGRPIIATMPHARSEGRCRRSPRRCRQGVGVRLGDRLSCAGCQTGSPSSCRLIRSNDSVSGLSRGVRVPPAGRGR